jgi:hypothetical protein
LRCNWCGGRCDSGCLVVDVIDDEEGAAHGGGRLRGAAQITKVNEAAKGVLVDASQVDFGTADVSEDAALRREGLVGDAALRLGGKSGELFFHGEAAVLHGGLVETGLDGLEAVEAPSDDDQVEHEIALDGIGRLKALEVLIAEVAVGFGAFIPEKNGFQFCCHGISPSFGGRLLRPSKP